MYRLLLLVSEEFLETLKRLADGEQPTTCAGSKPKSPSPSKTEPCVPFMPPHNYDFSWGGGGGKYLSLFEP